MPQIGRESITIVLLLIGSSIGPAIAAIYIQTYQQELANRVSSGGSSSSSSSFPSPISYDLIFLTAALISAISTD